MPKIVHRNGRLSCGVKNADIVVGGQEIAPLIIKRRKKSKRRLPELI